MRTLGKGNNRWGGSGTLRVLKDLGTAVLEDADVKRPQDSSRKEIAHETQELVVPKSILSVSSSNLV